MPGCASEHAQLMASTLVPHMSGLIGELSAYLLHYLYLLHHITGAITFVSEIPRVVKPIYHAHWQWSSM